jgi:ABC-type transport system involved in cytochrome c biogenesis ATPase subunit
MRIEINNICKDFGNGRMVLNDFSYSGDVKTLAVIGPSGGGKSTLLRIIGGLIPPTSGEVILDGLRVDFTEKNLVAHRRRIGFVFQSKGLFAHLSAIDNITMPLCNVYGYNKKDALKTASAQLDQAVDAVNNISYLRLVKFQPFQEGLRQVFPLAPLEIFPVGFDDFSLPVAQRPGNLRQRPVFLVPAQGSQFNGCFFDLAGKILNTHLDIPSLKSFFVLLKYMIHAFRSLCNYLLF